MEHPYLKQAVEHRAWIPNLLTTLRFLGGISLIFLPLPSKAFYIVYIVCGLTDALDGFVARRLKVASPFGAKLDSIADLTFYGVSLARMMPTLWRRLPRWIWYIVALVLAMRLTAYLVAAFKFHKFAAVHTIANKATGALVFGLGLVLGLTVLTVYSIVLACVAGYSSGEELLMHLRAPSVNKRLPDSE